MNLDQAQKINCLVFRTSLKNKEEVNSIAGILNDTATIREWSVDLEDWEKVLRIECANIPPEKIIKLLHQEGIEAEEMPIF